MAEVREAHPAEIRQIVGPPSTSALARVRHPVILAVVLALAMLAGRLWQHHRAPKTVYRTQPVTIGSLTGTVTASGNLQPRKQVEIGSELSGIVRAVYVEENDSIAQGQVLAALDTSRLEAQLLQAQGALAFAQGQVRQATAALTEASASLSRLHRLGELSGGKLPSLHDLDTAGAALARARGKHAAALAAVAQARANQGMIATELSKGQIRAPIAGLVLARSIEPGQTVAASLQAPVLFTVAEDLRKMELHVAIDEADVGAVNVGQHASFVVDAFPEQVFMGTVTRIHMASNSTRMGATSSSPSGSSNRWSASATGVVTYETVLDVDNSDLLLRPGMTATADIATNNVNDVTLIPNLAMRFTPQQARFPGMDDSERRTGIVALMPYVAERWTCPRESGQALGCVWVLEDGEPVLAIFKPGATDRTMTQVLPLDRLPNWSSLKRMRNDPVLAKALRRKLVPGVRVVIDGAGGSRE
jgi:HlyD family secretion protein